MGIGRDELVPAFMFGLTMFVLVMMVDLYACGVFDSHTTADGCS